MPSPVKGLEVYENMVEVLLVLEVFLTEDLLVEDLLLTISAMVLLGQKMTSQHAQCCR